MNIIEEDALLSEFFNFDYFQESVPPQESAEFDPQPDPDLAQVPCEPCILRNLHDPSNRLQEGITMPLDDNHEYWDSMLQLVNEHSSSSQTRLPVSMFNQSQDKHWMGETAGMEYSAVQGPQIQPTTGRGRTRSELDPSPSQQQPTLALIPRPLERKRSRTRIPLDGYRCFTLGPPIPKRSDAQKRNRRDVVRIGGPCIRCRAFKKKVSIMISTYTFRS